MKGRRLSRQQFLDVPRSTHALLTRLYLLILALQLPLVYSVHVWLCNANGEIKHTHRNRAFIDPEPTQLYLFLVFLVSSETKVLLAVPHRYEQLVEPLLHLLPDHVLVPLGRQGSRPCLVGFLISSSGIRSSRSGMKILHSVLHSLKKSSTDRCRVLPCHHIVILYPQSVVGFFVVDVPQDVPRPFRVCRRQAIIFVNKCSHCGAPIYLEGVQSKPSLGDITPNSDIVYKNMFLYYYFYLL
jgi:hypothetical protein